MFNVNLVRKEYPATQEYIYLDAAVKGLTPKVAYEKYMEHVKEHLYGSIYWDKWERELEEARKELAKLINSKPEEISFTHCTSDGLNIVANAIEWKPGDNIVINDLEFPSNVFPWQAQSKRRRVRLKVARSKNGEVRLEEYEKLIDDNTKVVAVSHVEFSSGFRHNLKELAEIAHEHGAYLVVDATQSLGAINIDVRRDDIDFLASAGFKWLMGPPGTGILYVKEGLIEKLEPAYVGWRSVVDREDFSFRWYKLSDTAKRFETGVPNMPGLIALGEIARFLTKLNPKNVERYVLSLGKAMTNKFLEEGVTVRSPLKEEYMSPIVYVEVKRPNSIYRKLREKKVIFSVRFNRLRFSPHLYNMLEEVNLVAELVAKLAGEV